MSRCILALMLFITACSKGGQREKGKDDDKPAPTPSSAADEHQGLPKKVKVSPAVAADARIRTISAAKEVLNVTIALTGEVSSDPDRTARISSPVAGRIEQVAFKDGAVAKKGDALAVIRVPELGKVRAAHTSTAARAKAARANAERTKTLWDSRLASEQSYLDAQAAADALDAEARSLGEQLSAMGAGAAGSFLLTLRAPLSGVVLSRDAVVGQPISADQVLGSIADLSEVWFLGRVFEKDLGLVRVGATAEVQLNAYSDERFVGAVESVGRQVDPVARTVTARIRITNRNDLLRIGLFGTARVATEEKEKHRPLIVVPRSAVTDIAGKSVVFVRVTEDTYELRDVGLGDASIARVAIVTGLREGEQVVVEGAFSLKSLVLKSTVENE